MSSPPGKPEIMSETKTRKVHTPEYKAKVALQALRSDKIINQMAKHFSSWLGLSPGTKISGGKVLSSKTKRSFNRVRQVLKMAAMSLSRCDLCSGSVLPATVRTHGVLHADSGRRVRRSRAATLRRGAACGQSRARKFRIQQLSDRLLVFTLSHLFIAHKCPSLM